MESTTIREQQIPHMTREVMVDELEFTDQSVKEKLKLFPLQRRLQLIECIRRDRAYGLFHEILECRVSSMGVVVSSTFIWSNSKKGSEYWSSYADNFN